VDENKQQALYWRDVGTLDSYYDANLICARFRRRSTSTTRAGRCDAMCAQYRQPVCIGEPGRTGMAMNSIITLA